MMMTQKMKKILCIIFAGVLTLSVVAGTIVYCFKNSNNRNNLTVLNENIQGNNHVSFKSNVNIASDSSEIQKNFVSVDVNDSEYILVYKNSVPDFFEEMDNGDIFCIYPDKNANQSYFALGFCGKIISVDETNGKYRVRFSMPKLTEVFSDVYINTQNTGYASTITTAFYPNEDVTGASLSTNINSGSAICPAESAILSTAKKDSVTLGDITADFTYKEAKSESLLDDYILLCEKLKLNIEHKSSEDIDFKIGGSVTLEETAVKMMLDYQYDEKTDRVTVNEYSLGFITKQKINLKMSGEKDAGLDKLNVGNSSKNHIIDVVDVTESEKGKLVLGTYLIGLQAALPTPEGKTKLIMENHTNDVSYLSLGIAVQLTMTANGTLSLEYSVEESGFSQVEVNGNGENTYLIKGYDYPNPVKDSREPTDLEEQSIPAVNSKIKGEASFDLGIGVDVGVCIFGMIPMKISTNVLEYEITRSFDVKQEDNKSQEIIKNNYLLDDNVNYLMLSENSYFKMHLGAKTNFGSLKYKVAETDGSIQLFKKVLLQYPSPTGFTHSQCGFGGVFVGERYSDQELVSAFKQYMKDTDQSSIVTSIKDSLLGSIINAAFDDLDFDIFNISDYLEEEPDNYKIDYFTSGIIYVRNSDDIVVAEIVTGSKIGNMSGVHNGLSAKKVEQIYSAPDDSAAIDISIGFLARSLLKIDWIDDVDLLANVYNSHDSKDKMELVFCDGSLKLIIVTADK